mmetsp:Transcript_8346/g.27738  ORF Transcript_8346/g.27738 Transcript_8346/m.27738 type:complete len:266 (-) Transcript_8346:44-841(-)
MFSKSSSSSSSSIAFRANAGAGRWGSPSKSSPAAEPVGLERKQAQPQSQPTQKANKAVGPALSRNARSPPKRSSVAGAGSWGPPPPKSPPKKSSASDFFAPKFDLELNNAETKAGDWLKLERSPALPAFGGAGEFHARKLQPTTTSRLRTSNVVATHNTVGGGGAEAAEPLPAALGTGTARFFAPSSRRPFLPPRVQQRQRKGAALPRPATSPASPPPPATPHGSSVTRRRRYSAPELLGRGGSAHQQRRTSDDTRLPLLVTSLH